MKGTVNIGSKAWTVELAKTTVKESRLIHLLRRPFRIS